MGSSLDNTVQGPSQLPTWSTVFATKVTVLHHIPKGARNYWAELITNVFNIINHDPTINATWLLLFMLPRCILANPANGDRLGWRVLQPLVKSRIRRWRNGDIAGLWADTVALVNRPVRRRKPAFVSFEGLRAANARRARCATHAGQYRKEFRP